MNSEASWGIKVSLECWQGVFLSLSLFRGLSQILVNFVPFPFLPATSQPGHLLVHPSPIISEINFPKTEKKCWEDRKVGRYVTIGASQWQAGPMTSLYCSVISCLPSATDETEMVVPHKKPSSCCLSSWKYFSSEGGGYKSLQFPFCFFIFWLINCFLFFSEGFLVSPNTHE